MPFQLTGPPEEAAAQLIAHLRTLPGFEGLFPEPDRHSSWEGPAEGDEKHLFDGVSHDELAAWVDSLSEPDQIPASSSAESDQQHLPGHPGVLEVHQPETAVHSPPLEARVDQRPGES